MNFLIIYKKRNGDILYRIRHSEPHTAIGKTTSMGWVVMDIKRMNNGKLYSTYDYSCLIEKRIAIRSAFTNIFNKKNIRDLLLFIIMLYILFVKLK